MPKNGRMKLDRGGARLNNGAHRPNFFSVSKEHKPQALGYTQGGSWSRETSKRKSDSV